MRQAVGYQQDDGQDQLRVGRCRRAARFAIAHCPRGQLGRRPPLLQISAPNRAWKDFKKRHRLRPPFLSENDRTKQAIKQRKLFSNAAPHIFGMRIDKGEKGDNVSPNK
jgi:hypothetical protein